MLSKNTTSLKATKDLDLDLLSWHPGVSHPKISLMDGNPKSSCNKQQNWKILEFLLHK